MGNHAATQPKPLGDVKALAASFKRRRWSAEVNLTSRLSKLDIEGYFVVQRELEKAIGGSVPGTRNVFGIGDDMNQVCRDEFTAMKVKHWTRRELWNRVRWLKGELSRLMAGSDAYKKKRHPKEHRDMTRAELIELRRSQVIRFGMALEKYAPMHKAITDHKRNEKKRKDRARTKQVLRRREIQTALGWLPKATTLQPVESPDIILVPRSSQNPQ